MALGDKVKHTDEGPIRTVRRSRNSRASNGSSVDFDLNDEDSSSSEDDGGIKVGEEYQAVIPACITEPISERMIADNHTETLIWKPESISHTSRVDVYLNYATSKFKYNMEQALVLLQYHKHDIDKAVRDLSLYSPCSDGWTLEEKIGFEQAFQSFGKNFWRIRQQLHPKSMGEIIKHYYSWKKQRNNGNTNTATVGVGVGVGRVEGRKGAGGGGEEDEGASNDTDSDFENISSQRDIHNNGLLGRDLGGDPLSFRRSGDPTKTISPSPRLGGTTSGGQRSGTRCPRGVVLGEQDLAMISKDKEDKLLKNLNMELISLKTQVQTNKQIIFSQKLHLSSIECFRPPKSDASCMTPLWTKAEFLLAVQGFSSYGKDFEAIAEVIGTKTAEQVRSFYYNHNKTYNLDLKIKECELKKTAQPTRQRSDGGSSRRNGSKQGGHFSSPLKPYTSTPLSSGHHPTAVKRDSSGSAVSCRVGPLIPYISSSNQAAALNASANQMSALNSSANQTTALNSSANQMTALNTASNQMTLSANQITSLNLTPSTSTQLSLSQGLTRPYSGH